MIYVGGEGPLSAKLVVVGEAPGIHEEQQCRPFVGPSGKIVDAILNDAGAPRRQVYLTNVVKIRPPDNKIKDLQLLGKTISDFIPELYEEIDKIRPNCILAFGATALEALTGYSGIEKYRGSILQSRFGPYKVVGTLHPAAILHGESEGMKSWKDLSYIRWDVERAVCQSKFPELKLPHRDLIICRNAQQLYRFLQANKDKKYVSVDIETFKTIPICIGLAFSKDVAISIPLLNKPMDSGMTRLDLIDCWQQVSQMMANPYVEKIGQNFKFDERQLSTCLNGTRNFGIVTRGFYFDTLLAFRVLYPELSGSLQFSTSVLTEEPYYKDEGKEYNPKRDKSDRLLLYNAKDAAVTYEVYERELEELQERGLTKFFFEFQMPLHPFYSRIEDRGILRDNFAKHYLHEKYKIQLEDLQKELNELTEEYFEGPVNVLSNSKGTKGDVPALLYVGMKLPIRKGVAEKDIDGLLRNVVKDPKKRRILELILEIRKVRKTIGNYIDVEVDHRGRLLTGYRIILETGRTSTNTLKPPVTTRPMGLAFQTITKHGVVGSDLRRMFIPDPGCIFLEPDLSGAEARVVAILADDFRLLKAFKYDIDIHRLTASWIFGNSPEELLDEFWRAPYAECTAIAAKLNAALKASINEEQRQLGKKFRHAGHYDMQKKTASENAKIPEARAEQILKKFHETNPNIKQKFHKEIQDALKMNGQTLVSPNGRQRLFLNRWGDELFREAYSQIPQSTVSDQTKKAARECERRIPELQILVECHDSFLAQIPIGKVDKALPIIKEEMESPIDFANCSLPRGILVIPVEIKVGHNWEQMEKV
jgi:uracil-DNA glycosylase family 4